MDALVIKYYRNLLKVGFGHAGSLDNPSIFLDSVGEKVRICGHVAHNFMRVYIQVSDDTITDITYLCTCDPTANVVVEALCMLVRNRTLAEVDMLSSDSFSREVGSTGEEFLYRCGQMLELMRRGIERYRARMAEG